MVRSAAHTSSLILKKTNVDSVFMTGTTPFADRPSKKSFPMILVQVGEKTTDPIQTQNYLSDISASQQ